jgi:hypothetical protein
MPPGERTRLIRCSSDGARSWATRIVRPIGVIPIGVAPPHHRRSAPGRSVSAASAQPTRRANRGRSRSDRISSAASSSVATRWTSVSSSTPAEARISPAQRTCSTLRAMSEPDLRPERADARACCSASSLRYVCARSSPTLSACTL